MKEQNKGGRKMQRKEMSLTKFIAAAAVYGLLTLSAGTTVALAASRGNSGLPPGPGNPLAALQQQINQLQQRVGALEALANQPELMWINHLDLTPGDLTVLTSFSSTTSGVGSGLSGLIITSTTTGEIDSLGGNKVVEMGLQVPPHFAVAGVRVCYESSNSRSFISQIRLAQLQDPPSTASVKLDDGTDLTNPGPICVDSAAAPVPVDPILGAVRLNLRVLFGDVTDRIVVRGLGLHLVPTTH
jgi:hypothetical protein